MPEKPLDAEGFGFSDTLWVEVGAIALERLVAFNPADCPAASA